MSIIISGGGGGGFSVDPDTDLVVNSVDAATTVTAGDALTTSGSLQGGAATIVGDTYTVILDEEGIDHSGLDNSPTWAELETAVSSSAPQALIPGGKLSVPPCYIQTTGDQAAQLTSANHKIAVGFIPDVDFAATSLSFYVKAVGTAGDLTITVNQDSTALEPDGRFSTNQTKSLPNMTTNSAPSPCVVGIWDKNAANAEAGGYEAYKAFDGSSSTSCRSNAAPSAGDPIYVTADFGSGNAKIINRMRVQGLVDSMPSAFTFWGSNVASPTVNTDDDWTELTPARAYTAEGSNLDNGYYQFYWTNTVAYRHYRWKLTGRYGAQAYMSVREIELYESSSNAAPGTSLITLVTQAVSTTGWKRVTFDAFQFTGGKPYWLVFSGQDAKDISLSTRRNNTTNGSMIPTGLVCKKTTDGTTWSWVWQDKPQLSAMLNIVLNSTANHTPQLVYGRCCSDSIPIYNTSSSSWELKTIPVTGVILDCESLAAATTVEAFLNWTGSVLVLTGSVDIPEKLNGLAVKSTDNAYLSIGTFTPLAVQGAYIGPTVAPDTLHVANRYNAKTLFVGKFCPFSGSTIYSLYGSGYNTQAGESNFVIHATDYLVAFTQCDTAVVEMSFRGATSGTYFGAGSFMIDGQITPTPEQTFKKLNYASMAAEAHSLVELKRGVHTFRPAFHDPGGYAHTIVVCTPGAGFGLSVAAAILGKMKG